ncbi:YcnI family protein [Streptomyces sp. SPB162]|uniref:YcnI family copper-binding membrane protein n=1 Tax=Streptomyces sp. SPB162 TaxID=2940560 RepID=UPI002405D965|nr:YcnI family protein [Streptomyces sp. SPB162]
MLGSFFGRVRRGPLVTVTIAVAAWLLSAPAASAHVTVRPDTAAPGSYVTVVFHVPSEQKDTTTTEVEVVLPADHPLASVRTRPLPGWHSRVEKTALSTPLRTDDGQVTEVVSKVVWTGGAIGIDQFEEFELAIGPLPTDVDSLVFKVLQTYGNGAVARWINKPSTSGAEPENPAPVLRLTAHATNGGAPVVDTSSSPDILARVLAVLSLAGATGAAAFSVSRRRGTR